MHTHTKINCCICGQPIIADSIGWCWGNNPAPLGHSEEDRCCDKCDASAVMLARYMFINAREKGEKLFLVEGLDDEKGFVECLVIASDEEKAARRTFEEKDLTVLSVEDLGAARAE